MPGPDELLLIGRRHKQNCNSWMHNSERLTKGQPRHHLLVNPADLESRGLTDGAMVKVWSRVGSVVVEAKATEEMMPGVVSLPHGFSQPNANALTDEQSVEPIIGTSILNGVPVDIERL